MYQQISVLEIKNILLLTEKLYNANKVPFFFFFYFGQDYDILMF